MERNGASVPAKPQPIPSRARSSSKWTSVARLEIRRCGAERRDEAERRRAFAVVEVAQVEIAGADLVVLRVRLGDGRGARAVEVEELRVAAVDREEVEPQLARAGVHDDAGQVRLVQAHAAARRVEGRVEVGGRRLAESLDALADGNGVDVERHRAAVVPRHVRARVDRHLDVAARVDDAAVRAHDRAAAHHELSRFRAVTVPITVSNSAPGTLAPASTRSAVNVRASTS